MENRKDHEELRKALRTLDGDREAQPLVNLLDERKLAREDAVGILEEAAKKREEIEGELQNLDKSMDELEDELIALADHRKQKSKEAFKFRAEHTATSLDIDELRRQIMDRSSAALRNTRMAANANPGPPIPLDQLRPGFAAQAVADAPKNLKKFSSGGKVADAVMGSGGNRRAVQALLEQLGEQDVLADKGDESSDKASLQKFFSRLKEDVKSQQLDDTAVEQTVRGVCNQFKNTIEEGSGGALPEGVNLDDGFVDSMVEKVKRAHSALLSGDKQTEQDMIQTFVDVMNAKPDNGPEPQTPAAPAPDDGESEPSA